MVSVSWNRDAWSLMWLRVRHTVGGEGGRGIEDGGGRMQKRGDQGPKELRVLGGGGRGGGGGGVPGTLSGPYGPYPGVPTCYGTFSGTFGEKLKIAILVPNGDMKCPFSHWDL